MTTVLRDIKFVIPAEKGEWFGRFGFCDEHLVPVIAWAYGDYVEAGPNFATDKATPMWTGIGVWNDGPDDMGSFSDFNGYVSAEELQEENDDPAKFDGWDGGCDCFDCTSPEPKEEVEDEKTDEPEKPADEPAAVGGWSKVAEGDANNGPVMLWLRRNERGGIDYKMDFFLR